MSFDNVIFRMLNFGEIVILGAGFIQFCDLPVLNSVFMCVFS